METQPPPTPRRRRRLPRALKVAAVLVAILLLLVLALPTALSTGFARVRVQEALSRQFGVDVKLHDYDLGWFSGLTLGAIEIPNPEGFARDRLALQLRGARGDISLLALLRGRLDFSGQVEGLDLLVEQGAGGQTNWEALLARARGEPSAPDRPADGKPDDPRRPSPPDDGALDRLRLDLVLTDSRVEIRHEQQVLEQLEQLEAWVRKPYDSSDVDLGVTAVLARPENAQAGHLRLEVDADAAMRRPAVVKFDLLGLDLARYRPLVNTFAAQDAFTAFAGRVQGKGAAHVDPAARSVKLEGNIDVEQPHFAGPLLADLDVQASRWTLAPNVSISLPEGDAPPTLDAEGLRLDLGFLQVAGATAEQARQLNAGRPSLGVTFAVDVGSVARMGGAIPAALRQASGTLTGSLACAAVREAFEPASLKQKLPELLAASIDLKVGGIEVEGHRVDALNGKLTLRGGKADLQAGADVAGGPLTLAVQLDAGQLETWPAKLALSWKEGRVQAAAVEVLRYAVPVLAGLGAGADLDFSSSISCNLELQGPLQGAAFDSTLAWLTAWSGAGSLQLANGAFTPSAGLQPLLQFTGGSGRIAFDDLQTRFALENGFLATELLELGTKAARLGFSGRTSLDGQLDYAIDLSAALANHKDGRKILEVLGGELPLAKLTGTLDSPSLALPDFGELLKSAGGQAASDLLKRGLDEILKKRR
jgi:hypothetical protein